MGEAVGGVSAVLPVATVPVFVVKSELIVVGVVIAVSVGTVLVSVGGSIIPLEVLVAGVV